MRIISAHISTVVLTAFLFRNVSGNSLKYIEIRLCIPALHSCMATTWIAWLCHTVGLDRKIEFGLPDLEGRTHIFKIHAKTLGENRGTQDLKGCLVFADMHSMMKLCMFCSGGIHTTIPNIRKVGRST